MLHLGWVPLKKRKNYSRDPIVSWAKKLVNTVVLNESNDIFPEINGAAVTTPHLCHCPVLSTHGETENCCHYSFTTSAVTDALQPKHPPPVPSFISLFSSFNTPNAHPQALAGFGVIASCFLCDLYRSDWLPSLKNMKTSLCKQSELPSIPPESFWA